MLKKKKDRKERYKILSKFSDGLRGKIQTKKKRKGADVWNVDILLPRWTNVEKGKLRMRQRRENLDG